MSNPITEDIIYLREISNLQSSLANLLNNVSLMVESLPDSRDYDDLIKLTMAIKNGLNNLKNSAEKYYISCNASNHELEENLEKLTAAAAMVLDNYDGHRVKTEEMYKVIVECAPDVKFDKLMSDLNVLSTSLIETMKNLDIKHGDESPTWRDVQLVVDMARRSQKRFEFWSIRKKTTAWIVGLIIGAFVSIDRILHGFEALSKFFK